MATYSNNTLGPIGTFSKMLKAVKDSLRWTCVGVVLGSRIADYGLDYPFPMGNVSSHTYTYAGKRSFACNCEENNGKCGLAPPNNRFERTHGTSPFAAQPNVRPARYLTGPFLLGIHIEKVIRMIYIMIYLKEVP